MPIVDGNTPEQSRRWMYCDSVLVRNPPQYLDNGPDKQKLICLVAISGVRGQVDSVLAAWRNGGAVPPFRRIQGMHIYTEALGPTQQPIILTIFHPDGTSSQNKTAFNGEAHLWIPLEADSIHVQTNSPAGIADFCYCVW